MKKTQKGRVAAVPSVSSTLPESRLESPKVVVTRTSTHVWHKPDATFPLGMSVLSSVFCCFVCGISGILVAWKARLLVLDEKYEHARVSIRIVWLLVFLAMLSGILTWIMGLITIPYFYKTLLKT